MKGTAFCLAACICLCFTSSPALGDNESHESLVALHFSPYVFHFNNKPEYNSFPWFVALEWESSSQWELGGAFFINSYDQPSGYVYGGKRWTFGPREQHLFLKLTAGAILGYVEPYEDKLPINANGIGLGIIPAVGYKYKRASTQLVLLGVSGVMITIGYDIWN